MADRVTGDQTDYVGRTCAYHMLPLPQTTAAPAPKMFLLCFSFSVLLFRPKGRTLFSSTAVLFCLPHLRGGTICLSLLYFSFDNSEFRNPLDYRQDYCCRFLARIILTEQNIKLQ